VAPDQGCVPRRRVRIHAPADPGQPGARVLPEVPQAIPHRLQARRRKAQGRQGAVGRARLLRASFESPQGGKADFGGRWPVASRSRRPAQAPRSRAVYGRSGGVLCVREARAGGGYQCGAGDKEVLLRGAGSGEWSESRIWRLRDGGRDPHFPDFDRSPLPAPGCLGPRRRARPQVRPARLDVQSGDHGARGDGVHCPSAPMPRLSRQERVQDGSAQSSPATRSRQALNPYSRSDQSRPCLLPQ